MYESYFNLRAMPFNLAPDPRFFFSNGSVREAIATLGYGVEQRKGMILITGEAGTGKTTLLKRFMQNASTRVHTSCILDPHLSFAELLQCAFGAFGLPPCNADRLATAQQLRRYLVEQRERDHVVALLLDEAQDLDDSVLEELRLLSDLEQGGEPLLQVVLVGQPRLDARLELPSFDRLKQRVTLRSKLRPLEREEICSYIDYRLLAAGYGGEPIFRAAAIGRIAAFSRCIPRLINVMCDNALLVACLTAQRDVGAEIIDEIAEDLQLTETSVHTTSSWVLGDPVQRAAPIEVVRFDDGTLAIFEETNADAIEECPPEEIPSLAAIAPPARASEPAEMRRAGLLIGCAMTVLIVAAVITAQLGPDAFGPVTVNVARIKQAITPFPGRVLRVLMARGKNPDADEEFSYADDEPSEVGSPHFTRRAPVHQSLILAPMTLEGDRVHRHQAPPKLQAGASETRRQRLRDGITRGATAVPAHRAPVDYVVVDDSFVRKQPTPEAEILMTLRPGTHVQLVKRQGDYLQVRSRERGLARGYVHKEDAFFQRLD